MKVTLPIITKNEIVDGKHIKEYAEKAFNLDMSLACQMRWEAAFPEMAKKENLVDYSKRIRDLDEFSLPVIISKMKTMYCYFDTETVPLTFMQFLKMFDFTYEEYVKKLTDRIKEIFNIIFESASEKNL
jgi:hypothetical protein